MHRHRVEKLIGEMDAAKRFEIGQRFFPSELLAEIAQRFPLPLPQDWKWLDDPIAQRRKKIGRSLAHRCQDIPGEIALVRPLFDDDEISGPAQRLPHLDELRREQPPEKRTDADVREVIAPPSNRAAPGTVIAQLRVIERLLHEPREGNGAALPDGLADVVDQIGIAGVHRVVKKVKSVTWLQTEAALRPALTL